MKRIAFLKEEADKYIAERSSAPCFICQIVAHEPIRERHEIVYEDEETIAFLSAKPTQYGQLLVCPKRHVEQIVDDLNEDEYLKLQSIVYRMTRVIKKVTEAERIYIASFGSQQMNSHVHFHIVPISANTPIREQQMASMMPELVGYLELSPLEWKDLAAKLKVFFDTNN